MKKRHKKSIASLLAAILCLNSILLNVGATAAVNSEVIYISTVEDLIAIAKKCSLDTWSIGKTVILRNDIDLTGTGFTSIPTFGGTFDGQGHTISGLSLTGYNSPQGLFRYIQANALVKNLTVQGIVTPSGTKAIIGGVAGSNSGTILNCSFIGTVKGDKYVGGIAGINEAEGLISNCSAKGVINGKHYVGGIAGENLGIILLCNNEASVNTTVSESSLSLEDLQNFSTDSVMTFSPADLLDVTDVGGIAGISSGIIQSCSNNGTVGYQHVGYNIGGIVGRQSGYLNGCTNRGRVFGRKDVGGIAGQIEPFSTWQLSEDVLSKLRTELNALQKQINSVINDSSRYTSEISTNLAMIQGYAAEARDAGDALADQTASWLNDNIDSVNDASARITETLVAMEPIVDAISGSIEDMNRAIGEYKAAMQLLENATDSAKIGMNKIYSALDEMRDALRYAGNAVDRISAAIRSLKASLGDDEAAKKALSDMQSGMADLMNAMKKISEAASALSHATDTLANSEAWQESMSAMREGAGELVTATSKMADALQDIRNALNALMGGFDPGQLFAALPPLENAVANLAAAAELSASGFSKTASGLEKLVIAYENHEETRRAWQDLTHGLTMVENAINDGTAIDYAAALHGLERIQDSLAVLTERVNINEFRDIHGGVQSLEGAMEDIETSANNLKSMIDRLQAIGTEPGQTDLEALMKGFSDLADAAQQAAAALLKINTALNSLLQSEAVKAYDGMLFANLRQIAEGVVEAANAMKTISDAAIKLSGHIEWSKLNESVNSMKSVAGDITRAIAGMQDAVSYVQDAWPSIKAAGNSASKALSNAIEATNTLKSSVDTIAESVAEIRDLISDLAARPTITFKKLDSQYIDTRNALSEALGNISDALSVLNHTASGASETLLADIQAISDQIFVIFDLLADAVEDVSETGTDITDYIEDISRQDTDSDTGGKAGGCTNYGVIQGDINVGGIAGSIAIEYDFDPEDDHSLTEKLSPGSKYLLRAVITNCENYGKIASKKNHAGGIVGLMDFGYVVHSLNNGTVSSIDGDYVGGIAGKSNGTIEQCFVKSSLSGADYIGGIAGYGTDLYHCYSLIQVENAHEFVGAIAGYADGVLQWNRFVNDELAGVNGVSYEGKAEPISYEELLSVEGLPDIFQVFRLTFVCDGKEVAVIPFKYGETISAEMIPDVPKKDGYFGEWDRDDFTNMTFDATVEAVYQRYITTLASERTRDGGLSIILVDGLFTTHASLAITEMEREDRFNGEQVLEKWTVSVTDDGQATHTVRYLAPGKKTSGINIYLLRDGSWEKAEYTALGSYLLFTMDGTEATFIVTSSKNYMIPIVLGILAVSLSIVAFPWMYRRRRNSSHSHVAP